MENIFHKQKNDGSNILYSEGKMATSPVSERLEDLTPVFVSEGLSGFLQSKGLPGLVELRSTDAFNPLYVGISTPGLLFTMINSYAHQSNLLNGDQLIISPELQMIFQRDFERMGKFSEQINIRDLPGILYNHYVRVPYPSQDLSLELNRRQDQMKAIYQSVRSIRTRRELPTVQLSTTRSSMQLPQLPTVTQLPQLPGGLQSFPFQFPPSQVSLPQLPALPQLSTIQLPPSTYGQYPQLPTVSSQTYRQFPTAIQLPTVSSQTSRQFPTVTLPYYTPQQRF